MKKTFKLIDLDCANCAAKMETAIKKLPGVTDASVSFMAQKMTIEADDVDAVMKDVVKCCRKVEPDCEIVLCAPFGTAGPGFTTWRSGATVR